MAENAAPQKSTNRGWYYALFFVFGALAGVGATVAIAAPRINSMQALIETQRQRIAIDETAMKQVSQSMRATSETLQERNEAVTLLYDPRALQSLQASGGLQRTYPNNIAVPYIGFPRWIIPGKVRPMVANESKDAVYYYFNVKSQKYEGPYLPDVPQQRP